MYPRLFQVGALTIPTAGAITAIAVVAALFTARLAARALHVNPEKVWDLGIVSALTAFFAPRLILIFSHWTDFVAHPMWMIGLVRVRSQPAMIGGLAAAVVAAALFAWLTGLPLRRTLDALALALAIGLSIFSFGALADGASFGTPTNLPWEVTYTSRVASLRNGTPLGVPLHPVQIYGALAEFFIFWLLLVMLKERSRWGLRDGEMMGAWLFLHGITSFLFSALRGDLTPTSYLVIPSMAAAMVLAGGLLWLIDGARLEP